MDSKKVVHAEHVPYFLAILVLCVCSSVIVGWTFDLRILKSILPSFITMKANTAIGLAILASCLIILKERPVSLVRSLCAMGLAGVVLFIGAATLAEYFHLGRIDIDEIFFRDPDGSGRFPPGRLAPITSISFILMALSIFFSENRFKNFFVGAQILLVIVFLTSFQALVGYALGLTYLFGSAFYTQMALHTAIAFIFLSLGFLLARADKGLMAYLSTETVGGRGARRLLAACVVVPLLVKFFQVKGEEYGYFDSDFGMLIQVMGNVIFLTAIVWKTTKEISQSDMKVKMAVEDFRTVQTQLKLIADLLPALVSYCDMNETYLFSNAAYETWFGKGKSPVGRTLRKFLGPEKYAIALPSIKEALMGRRAGYEAKWTIAGGKNIFVKVSYSPYFNAEGDQGGFVILVNDVTDLKNAVESRDNFLSIASHELKTPITSLALQNELRRRKLNSNNTEVIFGPDELREMFNKDQTRIARLVSHIDNMLDISRISSGKLNLNFEEFNLEDLFKEILDFFSPQFESSQTPVFTHFEWPIKVFWDRFRTDQCVTNLIANALKYGQGKRIEISVVKLNGNVKISVSDHGIGIKDTDKERIFGRFERAVSITNYGGLGLGLYLARDIVQKHRGELTVESQEGVGSTFVMTLPVNPQREANKLSSDYSSLNQ